MEETNSEIFLLTCTKHEDIGSIQSPKFVLNSLKQFITRHQFHRITSSALIAEYLMKPARNSKNEIKLRTSSHWS